jgi:hypothetical protein
MQRWHLVLAALAIPVCAQSSELQLTPVPYPAVNADTWVLIEIWPTVGAITLSAFFMDATSKKNESLCEATKRALDRDATALANAQKREYTTHRHCMTLGDAEKAGYIAQADR